MRKTEIVLEIERGTVGVKEMEGWCHLMLL